MKQTGIIMSGSHPRLILDGIKTMTRRVIIPQPNPCRHNEIFKEGESGYNSPPDWRGQIIDWIGYKYEGREGWFCHTCGNGLKHIDEFSAHGIICPYGQVGDRLWVRETWRAGIEDNCRYKIVYKAGGFKWGVNEKVFHRFAHYEANWQPSIHMFRYDSRITLEITEVRAERSRKITLADVIAEGFKTIAEFIEAVLHLNHLPEDADPWVWVIGFRMVNQKA